MSRTIHKGDSAEAIQRAIRKMVEKKKKETNRSRSLFWESGFRDGWPGLSKTDKK